MTNVKIMTNGEACHIKETLNRLKEEIEAFDYDATHTIEEDTIDMWNESMDILNAIIEKEGVTVEVILNDDDS